MTALVPPFGALFADASGSNCKMRFRYFATLAVAATSVALSVLPAQAAPSSNGDSAAGISVSMATKTDKEIRSYWTPERMREAIENGSGVPALKKSERRTLEGHSASRRSEHVVAAARAVKPQKSRILADESLSEVSVSQEVPYTTAPQYSIVGRLFFLHPDGTKYSCTASVIVSDNRNTLWTAGHCAHMGDGSGDAGFMSDMVFVPGYRDGSGPYGRWSVKAKVVNNEWMENGDFYESDYAALVLNDHPIYGKLQDVVGAFGYTFSTNITDHSDVYDAGYPGAGYHRDDLNAERMMFCYGDTVDAGPWNPLDDRMSMDCDMGKGASGGPMITGMYSLDPRIVGNNSHVERDDAGNRASDDLFSSEYDAKAANTIETANGIE